MIASANLPNARWAGRATAVLNGRNKKGSSRTRTPMSFEVDRMRSAVRPVPRNDDEFFALQADAPYKTGAPTGGTPVRSTRFRSQ